MLGSVPQSAKLMELAALFSWEAKSLVSASIGTFAVSLFPVWPGNGNPYEAPKIHHERTARSRIRSGIGRTDSGTPEDFRISYKYE